MAKRKDTSETTIGLVLLLLMNLERIQVLHLFVLNWLIAVAENIMSRWKFSRSYSPLIQGL